MFRAARLRRQPAHPRVHVVARALASAEGRAGVRAQLHGAARTAQVGVLDAELEKEIEKLLAEVEKSGGGDPLKMRSREAPKAGAAPARRELG